MLRTSLTTTEQGRAVLVKQAEPGPDADGLRHEATMLRAAAHPGVVAVVDEVVLEDGSLQLTLALAGSRTVADLRTDVVGVAGLVSALAATVADLHDLGIVHGRIRAEHVLVDASGRPVLCGFAGGGGHGTVPPGGSEPLTTGGDVAGLGALLAQLTEATMAPGGPGQPRWMLGRDRRAAVRRSLLDLAARATDGDPVLRPTARGLSTSILAVIPGARLPAVESLSAPPAPTPDRATGASATRPTVRRLVTPVVAALGLGLLAFGVGGLLRPAVGGRSPVPGTAPTPTAPHRTASTAPSTATATTATTSTTSTTAPTATTTATTVGTVAGPGVVAVDGARYAVGRPGDLLAVGDWDCDGVPTVAVVRPGSGEVFVFDTWAEAGHDAVATRAVTVPGAAEVEPRDDDGDGCPTLVVVDAAGRRTPVST